MTDKYSLENQKVVFKLNDFYPVNNDYKINESLFNYAIKDFETMANLFAQDFISDTNTRATYLRNIKRMSDNIKKAVYLGEMTPKEGAEYCNNARNVIMEEVRSATSPGARAFVEKIKGKGLTQDFTREKYAIKLKEPLLYKKLQSGEKLNNFVEEILAQKRASYFNRLTLYEQNKVYYSIIDASGKDSDKATTLAKRFGIAGHVLRLVTASLALYYIYNAEDKKKEAVRQGLLLGGGYAGGLAGGLLASATCGPAVPVCAFAFVIIVSFASGVATELTLNHYDKEVEEFSKWLN